MDEWAMTSMKLPKGITPRKFARMLQEWRERKRFSQRDAADHLGISKRTLENWEQERATPRGYAIQMLLKLIQGGMQPVKGDEQEGESKKDKKKDKKDKKKNKKK
jgi:DNA-binding transcriptional regulator YiaG